MCQFKGVAAHCIAGLIAGMLLSACAASPKLDTSAVNSQLTPAGASAGVSAPSGTIVQWGGQIIAVRNEKTMTVIEVLSYPLRHSGDPDERRSATGRFLTRYPGYLEPVDYASGRYITIVGELSGLDHTRIGDADYRLPVISARQVHLWPRRRSPRGFVPHIGVGVTIGL